MKHSLMTSVALIATLISVLPAGAEDKPDPVTQATEAANARAALVNAQAAAVNAQTALVKARSDALALPEYSGKTTTDGATGVMESWILSGGTVNAAATAIARRVNTVTQSRPVLIVGGAESVNFGLPASLLAEMASLQRGVDYGPSGETCEPPPARRQPPRPSGVKGGGQFFSAPLGSLDSGVSASEPLVEGAIGAAAGGGSFLPIASAVISALKTETSVTGLSITPDERTLIDAVAGQVVGATIPTEAVAATAIDQTRLGRAWNGLVDARNKALRCRSKLASHEDREGVKARVAVLDSAIQSVDAFAARATQGEGSEPSLLVRAVLLDALAARRPLVLRVSIEQAGGSLWKRDSLWTMVGFSGVRLTGGLVVSYRLADPATGDASMGGLLVCRTDFASMKAIQSGRTLAPDCEIATATRR